MAITDYSSLKAAISDYADRPSGTSYYSNIDNFIQLAESKFNLALRSQQMEEDETITTNSSGVASLPADYLSIRKLTRSSSPTTPIRIVTSDAIDAMNPFSVSGTATYATISGNTVKVAPVEEGDFYLQYFQKILGLSSTNTTNWLLTLAPQAYLFMCLAQGEAYLQNMQGSAAYGQQATGMLEDLGLLDSMARYANASLTIRGVTP